MKIPANATWCSSETGVLWTWPTLYKRTVKDGVQRWNIHVTDDYPPEIHIAFGLVGGRSQIQREAIKAGKNAGKKNETTPLEQALAEAEATWVGKIERKHYGKDPDASESQEKRSSAPMLAQSYKKWDKARGAFVVTSHGNKVNWADAYVQPKLDGHRLCWVDQRLYSRTGIDVTDALPHIVADLLRYFPKLDVDGEVYKHGVPVTTIGGYISGRKPQAATLQYHIYDHQSRLLPFVERFDEVTRVFGNCELDTLKSLVRVETRRVASEAEVYEAQAGYLADGYEGAMLRWGVVPYEAGKRSAHLLKFKVWEDDEFVVVAAREGRGTAAGQAIFECMTANGVGFEVTAPGTHEEKKRFYATRNFWIGKKLTVRYSGLTRPEDGVARPFHPVALQFKGYDSSGGETLFT